MQRGAMLTPPNRLAQGGEFLRAGPTRVESRRPRRSLCVASPVPPSQFSSWPPVTPGSPPPTHRPTAPAACPRPPPAPRSGIVVRRGSVPCPTARRVLRPYLKPPAVGGGSSCVRKHVGWTCQPAPA